METPSKQIWQRQTSTIFSGILLYQISFLIYAILSPFKGPESAIQSFSTLFYGGLTTPATDFWCFVIYGLLACMIVGYVLFLKGLGSFRYILDSYDASSVNKVHTGVILGLIGAAITLIPFMGWLAFIINLIGFIYMMIGYVELKHSTTFPVRGRKGASRLFIAMILTIIGAVLGLILFIGGFLKIIFDIAAFILVITGWGAIRSADPAQV